MKRKTLRKIYRTIRAIVLDALAFISAFVIIAGICAVDCGLTALSWSVMGVAATYLGLFIYANSEMVYDEW